MSQQLINHSPDLKRLRDAGYEMELVGGFLSIHHIPYLNAHQQISYGTLVTSLTLASPLSTTRPDTHVIHFIGENPCNTDGSVISSIQHNNNSTQLAANLIVNRSFSNKPSNGYPDYFQKVKRYADIISAPAKFMDETVTEKTFKVIADTENESVFQYIDTNSSRAGIDTINDKFSGQQIAIIGLGGTGAYVLDLVSKTPVANIHCYDGDSFDQHNAFRAPGATSIADLELNIKKADHFAAVYSNMHKGVVAHDYYVKSANLCELDTMSYVFVCVDKNSIRKMITDYLVSKGICFIDVGLGINIVGDKLVGAVRVTSATIDKNDHLSNRIFAADNEDNDYATNIQIADLNCLNAALAVMKWKKLAGFYVDLEQEYHSSYSIGVSKIFNEDATS
jgi:molybdopterin/thiamine biosynthesis adenylyltransferase